MFKRIRLFFNKRKLHKTMQELVPVTEQVNFACFDNGADIHYVLERADKTGYWIVCDQYLKIKEVLPFS